MQAAPGAGRAGPSATQITPAERAPPVPRHRNVRRAVTAHGSAQSVVERRAADVAVVGSSALAFAAAYTLAKRGKKVVLLPDYGLAAPQPRPAPLQPLKLTSCDARLAHLAGEAGAYWRGVEVLAGGRLLVPCPSLDLVLGAAGDHPAAAAYAALTEASRSAGVRAALLRPDELAVVTNRLVSLPAGGSALLQPDAGVLLAAEVPKALQTLAERVGVDVKERLVLRAWRDAGDHFVLSASSSLLPDSLSLLEAEQLLLAPGSWAPASLRLFGLDTAIEELQLAGGRWPGSGELQKLPLWNYLGGPDTLLGGAEAGAAPAAANSEADSSSGSASAPGVDGSREGGRQPGSGGAAGASSSGGGGDAQQAGAAAAKPAGGGGLLLGGAEAAGPSGMPCWGLPLLSEGSRLRVHQLPWQGQRIDSPFTWQPPTQAMVAANVSVPAAAADDDGASSITPELFAMHKQAGRLVRGVGAAPDVQPAGQVVAAAADGRPALGWHPGFEAGRVLVACELSSLDGRQAALPGYQLSPVLAKLAADCLEGLGTAAADTAVFELERAAVASDAAPLAQQDPWDGLAALQHAPHKSREQLQEEAERAEERRRDEERTDGRVGGGGGGGAKRGSSAGISLPFL